MLVFADGRVERHPSEPDCHSHEWMARALGVTVGQLDRCARVEVSPTDNDFTRSAMEWEVHLDEERAPEWWADDLPALEDKCRVVAERWRKARVSADGAYRTLDADGYEAWYRDGTHHREDGPAIKFVDGSELWYRNGELHRDDGPAIKYVSGYEDWWRDGARIPAPEGKP